MTLQPKPNEFALTYGRTGETRRDMDGLVRKHMPLVRRLAWHVHGSMSSLIDVEDLVQIGAYASGSNPEADVAIEYRPRILELLQQRRDEVSPFDQARSVMVKLALESGEVLSRRIKERQKGR